MSTSNEPVKLFFNNFWNGFTEKTDSMDCTFFMTLFEKVFNASVCITSSPDEATILVESIFGDNTYLYHKKWRATFLFSGESHYCNYPHVSNFDCVLGFEETRDRYVKCPLYLLFLQTNPSILDELKTMDKHTPSPLPPLSASVIITAPHGEERLRFMDRLGMHMPLFYGGKYKNNIGGPVAGHFNSSAMNEFYRRGKFSITMENADRPYYITEKLVNGLRSGVVPVYWGTSHVSEFFNPKRFLHLKPGATEKDISEMIERMKSMTDEEYLSIIREPIMTRSMEDVIDEIAESIKKRLTLLTFNVVTVSSS
jgi:hypothetical protein